MDPRACNGCTTVRPLWLLGPPQRLPAFQATHPPFGFALFYLRSVAPASIKSSDILLGPIPWVIIMLIMVVLVILFPGMVALSIEIFGRF